MSANDVKRKLTKVKEPSREPLKLSTGSTMLNLACTGDAYAGYLSGHYYYLVGDSKSGKTFLSLTCLAEAASNPEWDSHRFIFDNVEDGALMDIQKFFGSKVADRIEPPAIDAEGEPSPSRTIEEFYFNLDDALKDDRPFIYVLDSMDSLSSDYEGDKFVEHKRAFKKGTEAPGSYGDGKAKINSSGIRIALRKIKEKNSILIVISQTRDNLGFGFETKTRSGGRALRFYATIEMWSSCGKSIEKTAMGKTRKIGAWSDIEVKKNRVSGRERKVSIPIYPAFGMDDIGSCVGFLLAENHWEKAKGKGAGKIEVPEFGFSGTEAALIKKIEEDGLEQDLRDIVQDVWNEIEAACDPGRKPRYE